MDVVGSLVMVCTEEVVAKVEWVILDIEHLRQQRLLKEEGENEFWVPVDATHSIISQSQTKLVSWTKKNRFQF